MNPSITIRRALPSDFEAIMPLVIAMTAELTGETADGVVVDQITAEALGSLAGAEDDGIFVALDGDNVVGCGRARVLPYHPLFRFRSSAAQGLADRPRHDGHHPPLHPAVAGFLSLDGLRGVSRDA
jgi:hypothetical protein